MRVLVVASPMAGHVLPLVPVARALGVAGHEVALATAGEGVTACPLDVPVVDVAPGLDLMRVFAPFLVRHPVLAREQMAGSARGTRGVGVLLAPAAARMAEGVRALVDRLAPDLVVQEPLAAAGAEAAVRAGVPTVLVDGNLFDAEVLYAAATAAYGRRSGIRRFPDPAEVLTTSPPSVVGARRGRPMRFVGTKPDRPWAADLARPGDRPRVLVSRSTVADPRPDRLMSRVAAAAAGTGLDVVLVRPDRRVLKRDLPPEVRTTGWLPFPTVLPAAAGIVHHGGAGTLMTALAAGVPQVVVRGAGDRRVNADLVAARGAGIAADLGDLTPALLRRLVDDAALREGAQQVAAEIAAMPHPSELVRVLEKVADGATG